MGDPPGNNLRMILALTGMNFIQSEAPNGLGVPESSAMIWDSAAGV